MKRKIFESSGKRLLGVRHKVAAATISSDAKYWYTKKKKYLLCLYSGEHYISVLISMPSWQ